MRGTEVFVIFSLKRGIAHEVRVEIPYDMRQQAKGVWTFRWRFNSATGQNEPSCGLMKGIDWFRGILLNWRIYHDPGFRYYKR